MPETGGTPPARRPRIAEGGINPHTVLPPAEPLTPPLREKHDGAPEDRLDVRVWLRLLSCSTVIEKRLRRRFTEQFETTLPRFDILATLERRPDGATMGELSRALLVSNGNVTALVRQLEGDGLVTSRAAEDDRRSSIVALTDAGRAHFAGLAVAHRRWIGGMLAGVTRENLAHLFNLLAEVKTSLADERDGGEA